MSLSSEDLEQIPKRYRWLLKLFLKLPNPGFPYFVLKNLPEIEGIFWAISVPILLILYFFFSVSLIAFVSARVYFPLNILLSLPVPTVIFVFFLRIQLERTIIWWKNLKSPQQEWKVAKVVEEYAELTKKQKRKQA